MDPYAEKIINILQPSKYPYPHQPPSLQDALISYLSTSPSSTEPPSYNGAAHPFFPPNLFQLASAQLLHSSQDDIEWSTDTIRSAQDLLFQFTIGESAEQPKWDHTPIITETV
ncbi:hypothetical protein K443DRAFT_135483 [Laccaria amethystina LaAM-08-1]|uniref:Uncharacterized protein n=1 Tax=Laccaria amethystina LaAM-08-1 TaxID=1095629 RepID=A0A0C9X1N7_9AGAR|nr:hypothetical protein K443DRAFT_135483 [Laccaria amethystina LaAM-08-1]